MSQVIYHDPSMHVSMKTMFYGSQKLYLFAVPAHKLIYWFLLLAEVFHNIFTVVISFAEINHSGQMVGHAFNPNT